MIFVTLGTQDKTFTRLLKAIEDEIIKGNKVSFVMGHSSGVSSIQRLYTNFKIEDYAEVEAEQKRLFSKIHIDNTMC